MLPPFHLKLGTSLQSARFDGVTLDDFALLLAISGRVDNSFHPPAGSRYLHSVSIVLVTNSVQEGVHRVPVDLYDFVWPPLLRGQFFVFQKWLLFLPCVAAGRNRSLEIERASFSGMRRSYALFLLSSLPYGFLLHQCVQVAPQPAHQCLLRCLAAPLRLSLFLQ